MFAPGKTSYFLINVKLKCQKAGGKKADPIKKMFA